MECGEIDLAHVLQDQNRDVVPINLNFIRVYWEQVFRPVIIITLTVLRCSKQYTQSTKSE